MGSSLNRRWALLAVIVKRTKYGGSADMESLCDLIFVEALAEKLVDLGGLLVNGSRPAKNFAFLLG